MADSGALPLAGLTVVDLSRVLAGPWATQILGDLGAEVWKIERPGTGDETRAWGPPFAAGESAYFLAVNRNKKSAVLDLAVPADRDAVRAAAASADVLVENFLPGELARFGLDPARLRRECSGLVIASITGFGQDGPYAALPGYDAVLQGFTGLMSVTGEPGGAPLKVGVAVVDILTGAHAAAAILAALVGRFRTGAGAHLDVPLFEVGVAALANLTQAALATGAPARRHGNAHPQIVPYQTFDTADGTMIVAVGNDRQWSRLCGAIGEPSLARDAWAANPGRVLHRGELVGALAAIFRRRPTSEWLARLAAARVPAGPVRDVAEVVGDPALRSRGMIGSAELAGAAAPVEVFLLPWRSDGARPALRLPPPRLGEHTAEFLERYRR